MSAFERKIRRNMERQAYDKFTKEWFKAKRSGQKVDGRELGRKPGFSEFKRRMKMHEAISKLQAQNVEKENNLIDSADLEWNEQ